MTEEKIPFRGFDERGKVRVYYHGILPHWRQKNGTCFVTYRLADALPADVIREFEYERDQWLLHRGIDPKLLMRPIHGFELEDILQAVKSFTANAINRKLVVEGPFWMRESYDHIVRDPEQLEAFQNYIRANPEKAKLTSHEYILQDATYRLE